MGIVIADLKKTTAKGKWWLGRKICVRLHLAAYLLQQLYNLTDRQVEYGMKDNAVYQVFCGLGIVGSWHAPDHTKIEEFRSRLTPETQRALTNELAKFAVVLGFGDASEVDIDSTAQEANISYPADATLMPKLAAIAKKQSGMVHGLQPAMDDAETSVAQRLQTKGYFAPATNYSHPTMSAANMKEFKI